MENRIMPPPNLDTVGNLTTMVGLADDAYNGLVDYAGEVGIVALIAIAVFGLIFVWINN
jgi:hypothetical protein